MRKYLFAVALGAVALGAIAGDDKSEKLYSPYYEKTEDGKATLIFSKYTRNNDWVADYGFTMDKNGNFASEEDAELWADLMDAYAGDLVAQMSLWSVLQGTQTQLLAESHEDMLNALAGGGSADINGESKGTGQIKFKFPAKDANGNMTSSLSVELTGIENVVNKDYYVTDGLEASENGTIFGIKGWGLDNSQTPLADYLSGTDSMTFSVLARNMPGGSLFYLPIGKLNIPGGGSADVDKVSINTNDEKRIQIANWDKPLQSLHNKSLQRIVMGEEPGDMVVVQTMNGDLAYAQASGSLQDNNSIGVATDFRGDRKLQLRSWDNPANAMIGTTIADLLKPQGGIVSSVLFPVYFGGQLHYLQSGTFPIGSIAEGLTPDGISLDYIIVSNDVFGLSVSTNIGVKGYRDVAELSVFAAKDGLPAWHYLDEDTFDEADKRIFLLYDNAPRFEDADGLGDVNVTYTTGTAHGKSNPLDFVKYLTVGLKNVGGPDMVVHGVTNGEFIVSSAESLVVGEAHYATEAEYAGTAETASIAADAAHATFAEEAESADIADAVSALVNGVSDVRLSFEIRNNYLILRTTNTVHHVQLTAGEPQ